MIRFRLLLFVFLTGTLSCSLSCSSGDQDSSKKSDDAKPVPLSPAPKLNPAPDPKPIDKSTTTLIRGGRVMTAAGKIYESGYVLIEAGRIADVGEGAGKAPNEAVVIDAKGKVLTPGLIDTHSHMGVYPNPSLKAHWDGNEAVRASTLEVWAEHSFWPQDPNLWRAIAGGITTIQVLPGSANLFGGRTFTAKLTPQVSARRMRFPGAPQGLKMACGENPKRVYGEKGGPSTRMGNVAGYRKEFQKAFELRQKIKKYQRDFAHWQKRRDDAENDEKKLKELGDPPEPPARDLGLETLVKVLNGEILVHMHCYRADEMDLVLDLAAEYGFEVRSFHHAVESYKIRKRLAEVKTSSSTWADWWGFKMEAFDAIPQNAALLEQAGATVVIHSDSEDDIRRLHHEAAKAAAAGRKIGIEISEDKILRWLTYNAAWTLGIEKQTGTIEKGKMADLVIWSANPLSAYARAEKVFIDGALIFDRERQHVPSSDFEIGIRDYGLADGSDQLKDLPKPTQLKDFKPALEKAQIKKGVDTWLINNAAIWTGTGSISRGSVLVTDGKIAKLADKIEVPDQVETVDAKGRILTPGLFETRTQLGLFEVSMEKSTVDYRYQDGVIMPALRALDGFNPHSIRIPIAREHGVTSAISSPTGGLLYGLGFLLDLSESPQTMADVAMFGGVGARAKRSIGDTRGGIWMRLRELVDDARYYRKNRRSYDLGQARRLSASPTQLEALAPVLEGKVPLVLEAHRESDIRAALRFQQELQRAKDPVRIIIAGATEAWTVADELAAAKVPVIVTPSMQTPFGFEALRARDDLATILHAEKVPLVISSAVGNRVRRLRQEAGLGVIYGLAVQDALRAITLTPAEVFGVAEDRGSIEVGKRADLVLWPGDPFEHYSLPDRIWIAGVAQPTDNRQLKLARRYQAR